MANSDHDPYSLLIQRLTSPDTVEMVKRALAQGVVLDTWMNGEEEERISEEATSAMIGAAYRWTAESLRTNAIFPNYPMPEQYVRCVFHELLFSMAFYIAQKRKGHRVVTLGEMDDAIYCLSDFIAREPEGLTMVGGFFFTVSAHEDLSAISYYGRMKREDFLQGRLHRPWSNIVLTPSLFVYQQMKLISSYFYGEGDVLTLTQRGQESLGFLHSILSTAGEFEWRSNNQRWVIFSETDFDKVFCEVFPDVNEATRGYLNRLDLQGGMKVLEVGAGTGRVTVDLGLCDLVQPNGVVTALDPARTLLNQLLAKCHARGIANVEVVQGMAEKLPFPDDTFDATIAVGCLHFTDAQQAVSEMVRVTKPGGSVSAICPPAEFDLRDIPMVAYWFRPLINIAERFNVPFSERTGLPVGVLKELFRQHLYEVRLWDIPATMSAQDYHSFLAFTLRGAALFQNILCHLPYQERWDIIRRLDENGAHISENTADAEKVHVDYMEAACGRVPLNKRLQVRDQT